jgi:hypothetical protein
MGLFLVACATPALVLHTGAERAQGVWMWEGYRTMTGISLLVAGLAFGWLVSNFTAYANLLLFLSWIFYVRRSYKAARLAAGIAFLLSLETMQLFVYPCPLDEGGVVKAYLTAPHIGCFLWLASMVAIWFGSHQALAVEAKHPSTDTEFAR